MDKPKSIILLILSIVLFASCGKDNCEKCTRTWRYTSYTLTGTTKSNVQTFDGGTEDFYACGDDMIEAEEKGKTSYSKTPVPNYNNRWNVIEGNGTCNCN
jgi:hypothetical protein